MVTVSGGSFGQNSGVNLFVDNSNVLTLIGSNLTLTDSGAMNGGEDFALSGTLAGGTDLTGYVLNERSGFTGSVILHSTPAATPEPSTFAFLLTGGIGAGFAFRRRNRK